MIGAGASLAAEACTPHDPAPDAAPSALAATKDDRVEGSKYDGAGAPRSSRRAAATPAATTDVVEAPPTPFLRTGGSPLTPSTSVASPADAPDGGTPPAPLPKPKPKPQPHPDPCPPCGMG